MPDVSFDFGDSTVIITGASSGIGKATAEQFAADGADVAICSRNQAEIESVATAINESDEPGSAKGVECDVTNRDDVQAFVEETVDAYGDVDILVNNVGTGLFQPLDSLSLDEWQTILDVNLTGTYNVTQLAGPTLKADGGGVVVNIASIAGIRCIINEIHYSAAKAAIINLTEGLAYEWSSQGVRVNCVSPGLIATDISMKAWDYDIEEVERDQTHRRVGFPEEVADVIEYVASPASSFINGENIYAGGVPILEVNREVPSLDDAGY
jgi:3-oxoacyl-[acyl-carrier protein] reductase